MEFQKPINLSKKVISKLLNFDSILLVLPSFIASVVSFYIPIKIAQTNEDMLGKYVIELPITLIVWNVMTLSISGYCLSKSFQQDFKFEFLNLYASFSALVGTAIFLVSIFFQSLSMEFYVAYVSLLSIYFYSAASFYQYQHDFRKYFFFKIIPPTLIYLPWLVLANGGSIYFGRCIGFIVGGLFLVVFGIKKKLFRFKFSLDEFIDLLKYSTPLTVFSFIYGFILNWDRIAIQKCLDNNDWIIYSKHLILFNIGNFIINNVSLLWGNYSFKMLAEGKSIQKHCINMTCGSLVFAFIFYQMSFLVFPVIYKSFEINKGYVFYLTLIITLLFIRTIWQTYLQYYRRSVTTLLILVPIFFMVIIFNKLLANTVSSIFLIQVLGLTTLTVMNILYVTRKYYA